MTSKQISGWAKRLGPRKIGAIYVLVTLIVVFSIMSPSSFANAETAKAVLNEYAVTGLISLALLMPLASGLYDLSVGSVAGLAGITSAWMLANVSANPAIAIAAGVGVAIGAGLINSAVVLGFGIDSFIGTLATGSIFAAVTTAISGDNTIAKNVNGSFQADVALSNVRGITTPVFIALAAVLVLYVTLEKTGFGRKAYAIGFDREVARLGGVRVVAVRAIALVVSATLAGTGGILATAQIGAGTPAIGPGYLLPAFAAAFLGATQFKPGRFNAWGTVVAVLLLGTGNVGLVIVGAPQWSTDVFDGVMLIAAVGLTSARLTSLPRLRLRRMLPAAESASGGGGLRPSDSHAPAALASIPKSTH